MANAHRTNVLVTSCLKTPVDPHTKAPLAWYEREGVLPYTASGHLDNRDYENELEYEDSGSDCCDEACLGNGDPHLGRNYAAAGERFNLREIFFSNEEYYSKLEELKRAHLRTMAELESMYRQKLQLKSIEPLDMMVVDAGHRLRWSSIGPAPSGHRLRRSLSAVELRWACDHPDEDEAVGNDVEKGLLFSPKEHIKNMWKDFKVSPYDHRHSSSSLHSMPGDQRVTQTRKGKRRQEHWKSRITIPKPFLMTMREAERQKLGYKTRSDVELENTELRRQIEQLAECQRKFRASPVPAHVHLPLYAELQERNEERRKTMRDREEQHLRTIQKPFSFLERERLKKEQKQLHQSQRSEQEKVQPFKAKPVPKSVYTAALGEQMKEEQLYRSIKIQMRAQEMLRSSSLPPSMLTRRLSDRKQNKDGSAAAGDKSFTHRPQINKEVPDFDASYRRFQKHLEKRKEVKPTTACEPFDLKTSQISSHRERIMADIQKEQSSPRMPRWPYLGPKLAKTPNSSLCSSLSGSLEILPAKATDATKKRNDAVSIHSIPVSDADPSLPASSSSNPSSVCDRIISLSRKVLEQRKKAEEEEERWKEKQRQREKKLQRVVLNRAQANDPHVALSQTHHSKLKEFRKQDLQRKKEYQQEIKEMQQRVKGRPLLLEQVAQRNAKHAAEKRYTQTLHGCDVTEEFISSKAAASATQSKGSPISDDCLRDLKEADMDYEPVLYRKVFLDDEDIDDPSDRKGQSEDEEEGDKPVNHQDGEDGRRPHTEEDYHASDQHYSDDSYHYSDDHEDFSEDSDADSRQQEAGQ